MGLDLADLSRAERYHRAGRPLERRLARRLRQGRLARLRDHLIAGTVPGPLEQRELTRVDILLFAHRRRLAEQHFRARRSSSAAVRWRAPSSAGRPR